MAESKNRVLPTPCWELNEVVFVINFVHQVIGVTGVNTAKLNHLYEPLWSS